MKKYLENVYIVGAERSPKAGVTIKKDPLLLNESVISSLSFQELTRQGLVALFNHMEDFDVSPADMDAFFFASALSQKLYGNGDAYYALPQMLLRNAFPDAAKSGKLHAVGRSVEKACSSGGLAVGSAIEMIQSGDADFIIAGGAEKMCGVSNDFILKGLTDFGTKLLMATLSEQKANELQIFFGGGFGPQEHDDWGVRSYALARKHLCDHVVVPLYDPLTGNVLLQNDNASEKYYNRLHLLDSEKGRRLMCIPGHKINTSLNSSQYASGQAFLALASESFVRERNITPMAKILAYEESSEKKPEDFIIAPYGAMQKTLYKVGLSVTDLQHIELNEAFATSPLYFKAMGVPEKIINPWGGAIADGHPIGATFTGLTVKAMQAMKKNGQNIGGVYVCNAACEATGLLIEMC